MNNKSVVLMLLLLMVMAMSIIPMTVSANVQELNKQIAKEIDDIRGIKECAVVVYEDHALIAIRFDMVYSDSKANQLKDKICSYMKENYPEYTVVRITTKLSDFKRIEEVQSQINEDSTVDDIKKLLKDSRPDRQGQRRDVQPDKRNTPNQNPNKMPHKNPDIAPRPMPNPVPKTLPNPEQNQQRVG